MTHYVTPPLGALCYLATPYTKYKDGDIDAAFRDAAKLAAQLLRAGIKVYSPIAHCHPLSVHGKIDPLDHSIWLPFNDTMLRASDVLIVAEMDGWDQSKGVGYEIEFFERTVKPIFHLDPLTLTMRNRRTCEVVPLNGPLAHGKTRSMHAGTSE